MYSRCCVLACLATLMGAGMTAQAADLYRAPPPPPVSYVPPLIAANTWTGFYAGINGGYAWGGGGNTISYFDGLDQSARAKPQGGFGGGQIGYNYQTGSFIFGVETDFQGAGISNSVTGMTAQGFDFTNKESVDWFGTARGRLGFAVGNALLYGTGGFAYGNVNQRATYNGGDVFVSNTTQTGYAAGGGIEYKFNPAWSLKAEYQYIDLGSQKLTDTLGATTNSLDTNFQTARVGLNYRFGGGGYEPLK